MLKNLKERSARLFSLRKFIAVFIISLHLVVILTTVILWGFQQAYADRLYPGVQLAGLDFSGKNWDQAAADVEELLRSLEQTPIVIEVEEGPVFRPTLRELGVEFDKDTILANLFAVGRGPRLEERLQALWGSLIKPHPVELSVTLNRQTLGQFIEKTTAALTYKAENATLTVSNGVVEIVAGKEGQEADSDYLEKAILFRLKNIRTGETLASPRVFLPISTAVPEITETELASIQKEAQAMIGQSITMTWEEKTFTFSPPEIGSWLVFQEADTPGGKSYHPEFDDEKIAASVATKIARIIDRKMIPRKILITTGQVVEEGQDGRNLNRKKLTSEIKRLLAGGVRYPIALTVTDVPRTEQQVYPDFTLGLYEGRYLEINLTKQMLYAIEGGTVVQAFEVSTGKWNTPTPTGTLYIKNKIGKAYSRLFRLWMPYWNGLARNQDGTGYDGYGIHELPCFNSSCTWREGQRHLGTPVSHGCIRLGIGPAQFIYDWAPIGTPVFIHR